MVSLTPPPSARPATCQIPPRHGSPGAGCHEIAPSILVVTVTAMNDNAHVPAQPQITALRQLPALLESYTPAALGPHTWHLARPVVLDLAARTAPGRPARARDAAWALCVFLAGPYGWDQRTTPDLAALLTPAAITVLLERESARGSRSVRHLSALLRAAGRVARGLDAPAPARRRPAPRPRTYTHDASLLALAATYAAQGRPLTAGTLTTAAAQLRAGTALGRTARTLEHTYTARILGATDQRSTEAVQATPIPTTEPRISQRAQRARAKADREALRRATTGRVLAPAPDAATLPDDVRVALRDYFPRGVRGAVWAELRPLTLRMVTGTRPATVNVARSRATATVQFLLWLRVQPSRADLTAPLSAREVLAPDLVEAYIAHRRRSTTATTSSLRSTRSTLRHLVKALDAQPLTTTYSATPLRGPYSPDQCAALVELVSVQPSTGRRRVGSLIVGLALGAGLAARDLRYVRAADIVERDAETLFPYLTVTVPAGPAPRTVIIRDAYAPLVREGLALHTAGPDALLIGRLEGRENVTTLRLATADGTDIKLDIARMRTTWLFAMIHLDIPLPLLLDAAGLRTAATLADLLTYLPATTATEAQAAARIRALPDAEVRPCAATDGRVRA